MIVVVSLFVVIYIYKKFKVMIKKIVINCFKWIVNVFYMWKWVGFVFIFIVLVILGFILFMIGMM